MMRRAIGFCLALLLICAPQARAQEQRACHVELETRDLVGTSADVARLLDLRSDTAGPSLLLRRASDRIRVNACEAGSLQRLTTALAVEPAQSRSAVLQPLDNTLGFRSGYPRNWNDGVSGGGAGLSSRVAVGIRGKWGMLEAALSPTLLMEENGAYDFDPYPGDVRSVYAHRWRALFIDLPQRHGNDGIRRLDPGQSYIRINSGRVRGGFSTENLTWGPALRNPVLLSSTAPGFAHVFIESARPIDAFIGAAEFQVFWGRLHESDYYDFDPTNDRRALTGLHGVLEPRGLDGLHIGISHLHMQPWGDATGFGDVLFGAVAGIDRDSTGFRRDLRLTALSLRWTAAPGGFEVYGEWARQDSWREWIRLLNPLDLAQAYTIGAQRLWERGSVAVRLNAEFSHLSDALAHRDVGRGVQTFYVSPYLPHGHTHRGQLLGAPIGPGSESQYIGTDVFWRFGRTHLSVERVRYDDDAYYAIWSQSHGPHGHDTELSFRLGHLVAVGDVVVDVEAGYSSRYSRWFLGLENFNFAGYPYRRDDAVGVRVGLRWQPPLDPLRW